MILQPAYGRDYKTRKQLEADLAAGKDFVIADFNNPWCGKPVNAEQLRAEGIREVNIRYASDRKVAVVKL